ncbi:hypothetical protein ABW17_14145 [Mycobacterium nebraskense]|uniref:hypothetical protein n=1 Tax=Mycobacterium nebraskense TaxID=244292 RepID=UPI00064268FD|nr:hypothetical protein [Mycobacterium nebraskense]KLO41377.1 hypothetical protein ABW17_14145 [Mycobacterium nebraskense]
MIWREMIRNHHVDTIIPARESMYWVPSRKWKLNLVAESFKGIPRGRESDCTGLDMQNHIDVPCRSLYREAGMGNMQLNHEAANESPSIAGYGPN